MNGKKYFLAAVLVGSFWFVPPDPNQESARPLGPYSTKKMCEEKRKDWMTAFCSQFDIVTPYQYKVCKERIPEWLNDDSSKCYKS